MSGQQRDMRETAVYQEAEAFYCRVRQPGTGQLSDATEIHVSPCSRYAVFSGLTLEGLEGGGCSRVCQVDLTTGDVQVLTSGPNTDRLPRYSPDGKWIALLSDRDEVGNFQLYLIDPSGAARRVATVEGWVEYFHWSPDGQRVLLAVAGCGADVAGAQGAIATRRAPEGHPSWLPDVETGEESYRWRSMWIYELPTGQVSRLSVPACNVWEAVWCGMESLAVVFSSGPGESLWYTARLGLVDIATGRCDEVRIPKDQQGCLAASPSGSYVAVVEGIASDRCIVSGELRLIDTNDRRSHIIDTHSIDVTYLEWRSDRTLLVAGHRGFQSAVGSYDVESGRFSELWASDEITTAGRFIAVAGMGASGDFALVGEAFQRAPEIAVVRRGLYESIKSFNLDATHQLSAIERCERVSWTASDGLEIQGWLLRPGSSGPYPVVMYVHGGPVWQWRPMWLGRGGASVVMLVRRGFAVFLPNPRGSTGRGQKFARAVVGDMGGADAHDLLSGIDHLVKEGIADPGRLGVTGVSYGGFMSSWLITQDQRFAAAVPVAPVNNWVTEYLLSNISAWPALFLDDHYCNPRGQYYERSPVMHAHKCTAPTLSLCGALDRSAPPEEAVQFHRALLDQGVESVLVTYPEEGHGIRRFPALIDYGARVVGWFDAHL